MSNHNDDERSPLLKISPIVVERMCDSERLITRSRAALAPILEHADNVICFDAAVRTAGIAIKAAYGSAGLDYQLARHALWIDETLRSHGQKHPEIRGFGPSLVLLVREAERRFEREDRADELPNLIHDIAEGMPRHAVREKYLPPAEKRGPPAVISAVRSGRMEPARRFFEDCDEDERKSLRVFARGLALIVNFEPAIGTGSDEARSIVGAATSIEAALEELAS